jgi:hypothetical protein
MIVVAGHRYADMYGSRGERSAPGLVSGDYHSANRFGRHAYLKGNAPGVLHRRLVCGVGDRLVLCDGLCSLAREVLGDDVLDGLEGETDERGECGQRRCSPSSGRRAVLPVPTSGAE